MKLSNSERSCLKQISDSLSARDPEFVRRMAWPGADETHTWWRSWYRVFAPCSMVGLLTAAVALATVGIARANPGDVVVAGCVFVVAMTWMCIFIVQMHVARRHPKTAHL